MAHPASGGAVAADVGKTFFVAAIGRTERYLLYCLIHYEALYASIAGKLTNNAGKRVQGDNSAQ